MFQERIKSSPEKEVSDEILTEERAGLEKDGSKPLMEKAASLKNSDELHGFLDTREEDREESDILLGTCTYRVLSIHIGLQLILCVGLVYMVSSVACYDKSEVLKTYKMY